MDGDNIVEILLGRAHPNCDAKSLTLTELVSHCLLVAELLTLPGLPVPCIITYLQDFIASAAQHVKSDNLLLRSRADELHECLLLSLRQSVVQRSKLGRVDFEGVAAELGPSLVLGHPDAAYRRMGEHD